MQRTTCSVRKQRDLSERKREAEMRCKRLWRK